MTKRTYYDEQHIGSGGFGDVYSAKLVDIDHEPVTVALKKSTSRKNRPAALLNKRLQKEFSYLTRLKKINGVIKVIDYEKGEEKEARDTMVLQFAKNGSLSRLIHHSHVTEITAKYIFAHLAFTLDQIHSHGVAHLDIKAENILVGDSFELLFIDFGISESIRASLKGPRGTGPYMAPEMHTGEQYLGRGADVFAIGVLLFRLLLGEYPFKRSKGEEYDVSQELDGSDRFWR